MVLAFLGLLISFSGAMSNWCTAANRINCVACRPTWNELSTAIATIYWTHQFIQTFPRCCGLTWLFLYPFKMRRSWWKTTSFQNTYSTETALTSYSRYTHIYASSLGCPLFVRICFFLILRSLLYSFYSKTLTKKISAHFDLRHRHVPTSCEVAWPVLT